MKRRCDFRLMLGVLCTGLAAGTSLAEVTFDWATVGNPGNTADTTGYGSVGYTYNISKYDVTDEQYCEFLNKVAATDPYGLYNDFMTLYPQGGITRSGSSGSYVYATKANMANKPVVDVSYFDAMRFVNWLHNGQPTGAEGAGTTETGVYTISDGLSETRAPGAQYFLPSANEWYKAAYYDPTKNGGAGGYWWYATGSDTDPTPATANATGDISNPGSNVANYGANAFWNGGANVTTVGSAGPLSASYYGTYDQAGNVWQWNDAVISGVYRPVKGGSWLSQAGDLESSGLQVYDPSVVTSVVGFRVAEAIPEPSTMGLVGIGALLFFRLRPRSRLR